MASQETLDLTRATLDEVLHALVTGRPIAAEGDSGPFVLSEDERKIVRYYTSRSNRRLWETGFPNASPDEVDGLLDSLHEPLTDEGTAGAPKDRRPGDLSLKSVSIHHFGGIHAHCDDDGRAPPPLQITFEGSGTLILGKNGTGKTSLARAIAWGPTGDVLRSQDEPVRFDETLMEAGLIEKKGHSKTLLPTGQTLRLPPLTPVPTQQELSVNSGTPICETAVEAEFGVGAHSVPVRREIGLDGKRCPTAEFVAGEPSEEICLGIGVSRRALEVSLVMMARLPFIRLGTKNRFGDAVAELTGIAPLAALGRRFSRKLRDYLNSNYSKKILSNHCGPAQKRYEDALAQYRQSLRDHPDMALPGDLPLPGNKVDADHSCAEAVQSALRAAMSACDTANQTIRNEFSVDLEPGGLKQLEDLVGKAIDACTPEAAPDLPSVKRLAQLKTIPDQDVAACEALLAKLVDEVSELIERDRSVGTARRWRLYSMVAEWHAGEHSGDLDDCPVCDTPLKDTGNDSDLGISRLDAMRKVAERGSHYSWTMEAWLDTKVREFENTLPENVRNAFTTDEEINPVLLLKQLVLRDLPKKGKFEGPLKQFRDALEGHWNGHASRFPPFVEPDYAGLPRPLQPGEGRGLGDKVVRLRRLIAARRWRLGNESAIAPLSSKLFKENAADSLPSKLKRLKTALERVSPFNTAVACLTSMKDANRDWEKWNARIILAKQTAEVVRELGRLAELVDLQVSRLMEDLDERTRYWLGKAHRRRHLGGPEVYRGDRREGGVFGAMADCGGIEVPAHLVANASALRAYLFAFVIALWEKIDAQEGALRFLLLDDPQQLFDENNRRHLAETIAEIAGLGIHVCVTSYEEPFLKSLAAAMRIRKLDHRVSKIVARSPGEGAFRLYPSFHDVERTQQMWKEACNDDVVRDGFVRSYRTWIEGELKDMLVASGATLPAGDSDRTLAGFRNRIVKLRGDKREPFTDPAFDRLLALPVLQDKSASKKTADEGSHEASREHMATDAKQFDDRFGAAKGAIDGCWDALQTRTSSATTAEHRQAAIVPLISPRTSPHTIDVIGLAAAQQGATAEEDLPGPSFQFDPGRHALFAVGGGPTSPATWLGGTAWPGQTLVVDTSLQPSKGDLVVARAGTVFPGWLAGPAGAHGDLELIGRRDDGSFWRKSFPVGTAEANKVVGVLFDQHPRQGKQPAFPVETSPLLEKTPCLIQVVGDSAVPLVAEGQHVFATERRQFAEELDALEGHIVVASLSSGRSVIKRLGRTAWPGGACHVLSHVGHQGDDEVVGIASADGRSTGPTEHIERLFDVVGWLFEPIGSF